LTTVKLYIVKIGASVSAVPAPRRPVLSMFNIKEIAIVAIILVNCLRRLVLEHTKAARSVGMKDGEKFM
jgi:hypothetical protein